MKYNISVMQCRAQRLARQVIVILLAVLSMQVFVSCTSKKSPVRSQGSVVIGIGADFDSFNELNAANANALQVIEKMLFMTLTRLDEALEMAPYLARTWEFTEQGKVLTYFLREDIFWSDGQQTTADDVKFTYDMAVHADVGYPAASRFDLVERVEVINPFTVRFILKKAYPDVLHDLAMPILPKHVLSDIPPESVQQASFNRHPVTNGPFRLLEWRANERIVFQADSAFAPGPPHLKRVIFQVIPESSVLLTNLAIGTVDVCPALIAEDLPLIQGNSNLEVLRYDSRGYTFLAWNCARPYLPATVRKALSKAIDKKMLIATVLQGYGKPAKGPFMPFTWAYDPSLDDLTYDPVAAQNLLHEQGWADVDGDGVLEREGRELTLTLKTNAGSQFRRDLAVLIQAQLRKVGVKAEVEIVEFNQLMDQIFGARDFDVFLSGWDADFTVNPHDLFHTNAIEHGYNFVSYSHARVDTLLLTARAMADKDAARPLWREFQQIIIDESPYTFLFIGEKITGYNRRIKGMKMDVRGFLSHIHEWTID